MMTDEVLQQLITDIEREIEEAKAKTSQDNNGGNTSPSTSS
jgi:hypothetical protein